MDALSQLFYLHGIGYEFTKYTGEQVIFSEGTRKRALQCCGVNTEDEHQIAQLNYQLDVAPWLELAPDTSLVNLTDNLFYIRIDERQRDLPVAITLPKLNVTYERANLHNLAIRAIGAGSLTLLCKQQM